MHSHPAQRRAGSGSRCGVQATGEWFVDGGGESCDEMLKGLEGLDGSRTVKTEGPYDSRTIETIETKELMRNLAALRET